MQMNDFSVIGRFKSFWAKLNKKWLLIFLFFFVVLISFVYFYRNSSNATSDMITNSSLNATQSVQTENKNKESTATESNLNNSNTKDNQLINDINDELGGTNTSSTNAAVNNTSNNGLSSVLKVVMGLAVVIILIYLTIFLLRFINKNKTMSGLKIKNGKNLIKVIDSANIAPNKSIQLVSIAGKMIIIGVAEKEINFLTELAPNNAEDIEEFFNETKEVESKKMNFKSLLASYFKK